MKALLSTIQGRFVFVAATFSVVSIAMISTFEFATQAMTF